MTNVIVLTTPSENALKPIGDKAIISQVIESFLEIDDLLLLADPGTNMHIFEDYLSIVHPKIKFKVNCTPFHLNSSKACLDALIENRQCITGPFVLTTTSTLFTHLPPPDSDWSASMAYGIANTNKFIDSLVKDRSLQAFKNFNYRPIPWFDIKTSSGLLEAMRFITKCDDVYDFSKPDEAIYFANGKVIKFFLSESIVSARVKRAKILTGLVPEISDSFANFYCYKKIEGETLYEADDAQTSLEFYQWCRDKLWNPEKLNLNMSEHEKFLAACHEFYYVKTLERARRFFHGTGLSDSESEVNGEHTPTLEALLAEINWSHITSGIPSRFHGDLQFDNVLVTHNHASQFVLLDWRQEFAGLIEYGDLYYDLAKLLGGLIIPYNRVKRNQFTFVQDGDKIQIALSRSKSLVASLKLYENFIIESGFDLNKVRTLVGLIFINMSPLHSPPFDRLLHHLGKVYLKEAIDGKNK